MYHLWPQTEYIIILLCKTYNFVQYILCRTTKMQLDIAFLTNRENIQKFLKKVVDNNGMLWYYNQAVTKTANRKRPRGSNLKPSNRNLNAQARGTRPKPAREG